MSLKATEKLAEMYKNRDSYKNTFDDVWAFIGKVRLPPPFCPVNKVYVYVLLTLSLNNLILSRKQIKKSAIRTSCTELMMAFVTIWNIHGEYLINNNNLILNQGCMIYLKKRFQTRVTSFFIIYFYYNLAYPWCELI